jgi:uncharacterized protein YaiE (UPF0345 family)
MDKFANVTVVTAANVYFDGKVTSRTLEFADGSIKTLGIMLPGDYEFGTAQPELMEITAGELLVKLPGSESWDTVGAGQSFRVPGDARFNLQVLRVTDYVCSYL